MPVTVRVVVYARDTRPGEYSHVNLTLIFGFDRVAQGAKPGIQRRETLTQYPDRQLCSSTSVYVTKILCSMSSLVSLLGAPKSDASITYTEERHVQHHRTE